MEDLILSQSEYEALLEEVHRLQARISELTAFRDDLLYHICPALRAEYEEKIASLEREILAAEMYLRENQRILEILQAQMNHQKEPSIEEAEKEAKEEFREYEDDLKKKAKEAEGFRRHWEQDTQWSEHDRKEKEEQEKEEKKKGSDRKDGSDSTDDPDKNSGRDSTGHNGEKDDHGDESEKEWNDDPAEGTSGRKDSPSRKLKRLYRMIVKRLHPDVHPNPTLREKELLNLAQEAMKTGDLEMMERIWDELSGMDSPEEKFEDTAEGITKLKELVQKLRERMNTLETDIRHIRTEFPYTMKSFLENDEAVEERRSELQNKLKDLREANEKLAVFIQQIRQKMGM